MNNQRKRSDTAGSSDLARKRSRQDLPELCQTDHPIDDQASADDIAALLEVPPQGSGSPEDVSAHVIPMDRSDDDDHSDPGAEDPDTDGENEGESSKFEDEGEASIINALDPIIKLPCICRHVRWT